MRFIIITVMFFSLSVSYAQKRYNVFSLEAGGGVHVPYSPKEKVTRSNYISLEQFQFSARYMFNEQFGLKGQYAYHLFKDREDSQKRAEMHKFTLEAVYNIGKALNFNYTIQERFVFLAHVGVGMSVLTPQENPLTYERLGNIQFGLTSLVKISDRVAFFIDGTPVVNLKQHYSYGGELLNQNYKAENGIFLTLNAGLVFYIGDKHHHADWY